MKRTIAILLSILILLNLCSSTVNATSIDFGDHEPLQNIIAGQEGNNLNSLYESGSATTHGNGEDNENTSNVESSPSFFNGITNFLKSILFILPGLANNILSFIIYGNFSEVFTIEKLLCNEYELFDINFFELKDENIRYSKTINMIKESVATWYVASRNIAAVAIVMIAIYTGIRMALSTVADSKAKYKKMFLFWIESVILLFIMHYFVLLILNAANTINNVMIQSIKNINGTNIRSGRKINW